MLTCAKNDRFWLNLPKSHFLLEIGEKHVLKFVPFTMSLFCLYKLNFDTKRKKWM